MALKPEPDNSSQLRWILDLFSHLPRVREGRARWNLIASVPMTIEQIIAQLGDKTRFGIRVGDALPEGPCAVLR